MDKVLQTGLTSGMSAVAGIHSKGIKHAPPEQAGKNIVLTSAPNAQDRVSYPVAAHAKVSGPVKASRICVGGWSWGDKGTWHWDDSELPGVKEAWENLYAAGVNFIDTAEAYGDGASEKVVSELVRGKPRDSVVVQTKWLALPLAPNNLLHPVEGPVKALKGSLKGLGLDYVDIFLVHGHIHFTSIATVAKGLAQCVEEGLTRAVGVANYDPGDALKMRDELAKYNVPLACNQTEFSILRRYPEVNGHIKQYHDAGLVFQAYSSLGQGRLTGKYTKDNPPPKTYRFSSYPMEDLEPTLQVLQKLAQKHNKSMAAVALNWNMVKGAVPLVGIRNPKQAEQAIEALGWKLHDEDIRQIDDVSFEGKATKLWQQG